MFLWDTRIKPETVPPMCIPPINISKRVKTSFMESLDSEHLIVPSLYKRRPQVIAGRTPLVVTPNRKESVRRARNVY